MLEAFQFLTGSDVESGVVSGEHFARQYLRHSAEIAVISLSAGTGDGASGSLQRPKATLPAALDDVRGGRRYLSTIKARPGSAEGDGQ